MSVLETAKQVVAENIGWNGEPAGATLIAAALVEADGHISNLASMLEAAHRQLGIYSKDNKRLAAARAFLSRISKEQDNG